MLAAVVAATIAASPALAASKAGAAGGAAPEKEPIPFKRDAEPFEPASLLRIAMALGLVIALAAGGLYMLRRYLPSSLGRAPGGASRINVLEIRRITPRLTLLLIEIDGQPIFLAQSGDRVHPLPLGRTDGAGGAR
jgi:flagellar biogenesis protein FliO